MPISAPKVLDHFDWIKEQSVYSLSLLDNGGFYSITAKVSYQLKLMNEHWKSQILGMAPGEQLLQNARIFRHIILITGDHQRIELCPGRPEDISHFFACIKSATYDINEVGDSLIVIVAISC